MDVRKKYPHFLTREFEASVPEFQSHDEAVAWFSDKFGKNFVFTTRQYIGNEYINFYHLIVQPEHYHRYFDHLNEHSETEQDEHNYQPEKHSDINESGMYSYHDVEITDDGGVHIVF